MYEALSRARCVATAIAALLQDRFTKQAGQKTEPKKSGKKKPGPKSPA